ncbi:beta/gamma crystallin domain-containing protein 1-like [Brachionichthys hirsutus]|uniref:beta/gamma crystallin domain-containing protein 1-like n=1 Tax=Brachionichthys hirsutus TaxID=412623 RepID=UPI003604691F
MFTSYVKNLNDMVFSTAESSEEQPSPGVLGRIGSWLSPWRARTPNSPTETSPTTKPEGEEEGEGSARPQAGERRSEEEEEEQSADPNRSGDVLPHKEDDARESAHTERSSPETAEGGPTGEEFVWSRSERGERKEREESSHGMSESGTPEKNTSHLTHPSSSSEQGVACDLSQTQAQTGRKLHVYLEETSVIQCGQEVHVGQQVVHTTVTKSLEIPRKSPSGLDSTACPGSSSEDKKRINVNPVFGTESKSSQFESAKEQTGGDSMGRKNGRKKARKNPQGDGNRGLPKAKPVPDGFPPSDNSLSGTEAKSPKTVKGESPLNSSSKRSSASELSPERQEGKTSCLDAAKPRGKFQDTGPVRAASLECAVDGPANMEDEDSFHQAEDKAAAPESKRRSIKVSRSEVKLFTKTKPVPEGGKRDANTKSLTKAKEPPTEPEARPRDSRTRTEDLKPETGRITDKIRLFERSSKQQTFQMPRSVDASPVRKVTDRLKADFMFPEQRSKSAERYDKARSNSSSPGRAQPLTIKERTRNFIESGRTDTRTAPPPKAATTGTSQERPVFTSKSQRANNRGKPANREETESKTASEATPEPEERDAAPSGRKTSESDEKAKDVAASQTAAKGQETTRIEAHVLDKGSDPSVEPTSSISQQSKAHSRPGSRSKRRKSCEPNSETEPDQSAGRPAAAPARRRGDGIKETASAPKRTDDEAKGSSPEQPSASGEEKTSQTELKAFDQQSEASVSKPEPGGLVGEDEPDTKVPHILPPTGGDGLFSLERGQVNSETEKRQPLPPPPPPNEEQESPIRHPTLGTEFKSENKIMAPNKSGQTEPPRPKETELMSQADSKAVDKGKTNQSAMKGKEKPQQLQPSDTIIPVPDGEQVASGTEGGVGGVDERQEKSRLVTDKGKPQTSPTGLASEFSERTSSRLPPETAREEQRRTRGDEEPLIGRTAVVRAETQTESVSVEKSAHAPDESRTGGANGANAAAEGPATNGAPAPLDKKPVGSSEKELGLQKPTSVSASQSVCSDRALKDDERKTSAPSEVTISGETAEAAFVEASKDLQSADDTASVNAAGTAGRRPADGAAVEKTDETTQRSPIKEESLVRNGALFPRPDLQTVTKRPPKSQTPRAPASPEAEKLFADSIQLSSMKWGLGKDDSATQDVPSSWLDLDFPKQKLKVSAPKLSSSGSESNLLDTSGELDDEDFVEKIKKLCAPFSLPPRKHYPLRPPQPPFVMPAIKEDRFEKTFDPEEFMFGLRKKNKFSIDSTPSQLAKLQNSQAKSGLKPARASLADRSILLSSLDFHSRLKDKDEDGVKEEKEQVKVKSRLEGSCVLSSLASSNFRGRRDGRQTQGEDSSSGEVSPTEVTDRPSTQPPPPPPSPTSTAPLHRPVKQSPAHSGKEEAQAGGNEVGDSGPPFPSFIDTELPEHLKKYLPQKPAKPVPSVRQQQDQPEVIGNMVTPVLGDETDQGVKPDLVLPGAASPTFPGAFPGAFPVSPSATRPTFPEFKKAQFKKRTAKGFHKRPGKMVLYDEGRFSGQAYEIHRDVTDATSLELSPLVSVKVVRGCWVLYEKPDFQGRPIALEEGGIELTNVWAEEADPEGQTAMQIGSIRLAVRDYGVPRIDLFTEPEGHGRVTPYYDDAMETGAFGVPLSTASVQVHSGVWLLFSDPGFQGMLAVLETGEYPFPDTWGFPSPFVGSLRPLKMGGLKVEHPSEVKAVVYEKPGFEGSGLEIDGDVLCFSESEGGLSADVAKLDPEKLGSVGSIKIMRGLWVGYSEPGFEGQQHILEEGEYLDCSDWGGSDLVSLRPILSDFLSPHLKMFSDRDFGERGVHIDVTVPVISMNDTGYGVKTQSVDVIGGSWVVFEEPGFCGESYILEKGLYGSPEDWGALQPRVASAMPVVLVDFENTVKFKVQLFSEPEFQGSALTLQDGAASLQDGFSVGSCKVLAGGWLAFEERDFAGRMYVLEEGSYSDLRAMGCTLTGASVRSLQTVGFEFSLPAITLFERSSLRGKRIIVTDGTVNLQLAGGCSRVQSLLVEGGIWVLYEGINYRGAQVLLRPGAVPDWHKVSGWRTIGSLRPLLQKQVHFRLRNRQTGLVMSVTGDLDDIKLLRIQEGEETGGLEQIWFYQDGHLHCKLLEDCCLSPSSSVTVAGARVGLDPEPGNHLHRWSITPEGVIGYTPTPGLVLEVKGGHNYDKNLVILNALDPKRGKQQWDVEVV